jgi:hypothetical protein
MRDRGSLEILPEPTGGRVVINTNPPEEKVPGIFHESDTHYVLPYGASDPTASLDVKVARSGAHVSTIRYARPPGSNRGQTRVRPLRAAGTPHPSISPSPASSPTRASR